MTELPSPYPRQDLLAQHVQPSRSRLPLAIAGVAVVVAVVAGLALWWVARDDGEQNRAAYCAALKRVISGEGLSALVQASQGGGTGVPRAIDELRSLAPGSVRTEWDDLIDLLQSIRTTQPGIGEAARAFNDIRVITDDANSGCGLKLQIPG